MVTVGKDKETNEGFEMVHLLRFFCCGSTAEEFNGKQMGRELNR